MNEEKVGQVYCDPFGTKYVILGIFGDVAFLLGPTTYSWLFLTGLKKLELLHD